MHNLSWRLVRFVVPIDAKDSSDVAGSSILFVFCVACSWTEIEARGCRVRGFLLLTARLCFEPDVDRSVILILPVVAAFDRTALELLGEPAEGVSHSLRLQTDLGLTSQSLELLVPRPVAKSPCTSYRVDLV